MYNIHIYKSFNCTKHKRDASKSQRTEVKNVQIGNENAKKRTNKKKIIKKIKWYKMEQSIHIHIHTLRIKRRHKNVLQLWTEWMNEWIWLCNIPSSCRSSSSQGSRGSRTIKILLPRIVMGQAEQFLARRCDFSFGHRAEFAAVRVRVRVRLRQPPADSVRGNSCVNGGQGAKAKKATRAACNGKSDQQNQRIERRATRQLGAAQQVARTRRRRSVAFIKNFV